MANQFEIKIWTVTDPKPTVVSGGVISSTNNGDGTWTLSSPDPITHFKDLVNEPGITKIEVINGETLLSLESSFSDLIDMTEFIWNGPCNVTNFHTAWNTCSQLESFPQIDTSKGTNFWGTWGNCSSLSSFPELDFSSAKDMDYAWWECHKLTDLKKLNVTSLEHGTQAFHGCKLLEYPPTTGTQVRDYETLTQGLWPDPNERFKIRVWSSSDPTPSIIVGGNLNSKNDNGIWSFTSADEITHIAGFGNKNDITRIEVVSGETLISLEETFSDLLSMTEFVWYGKCNVENFHKAWNGCSSLFSFPYLDTSHGTNFNETWRNCSNLESFPQIDVSRGTTFIGTWQECYDLKSFPELDFSNGTEFTHTWASCISVVDFVRLDFSNLVTGTETFKDCVRLTNPAKSGTLVRDGDNALKGFWKYIYPDLKMYHTSVYQLDSLPDVKPKNLGGKFGFKLDVGSGSKWEHDGTEWKRWMPTQLIGLESGDGKGWRLVDSVADNYTNIGIGAVDFTLHLDHTGSIGAGGQGSFSFGEDTLATGVNSAVGGTRCSATGEGSFSIGYQNVANGAYSTAIVGGMCEANESNTLVGGIRSKANGKHSMAIGRGCISDGVSSTTLGQYCFAKKDGSVAIGTNLTANMLGGAVFGMSNIGKDNTSLEVGAGSVSADSSGTPQFKRNVFEVYTSGEVVAPECSLELIHSGSLQVLTTKEYVTERIKAIPTGVSADAGNKAILGSDDLVYVGQMTIPVMDITWDELVQRQHDGNVQVWDRYNITDQNNLKIEIKLQSPLGDSFFDVIDMYGVVTLKQIK